MKRKRRRRAPRLPQFRPVDQLAIGEPVNPYRAFQSYHVRRAIMAATKLRPGAKLVLILLCDECYVSGFDKHTNASLATKVGLSLAQLKRHLRHLATAHLVHVEPELGRQNFRWLLWAPLFADCSPSPQVTSDPPPRSEVSQGVGHKRATQRNSSEELKTIGSATGLFHTTSVDNVPPNGRTNSKGRRSPPDWSEVPITESMSTLRLDPRSIPNFSKLPLSTKRQITAHAEQLAREVAHFRPYVNDPHPNISRQARYEITRRLAELGDAGFYLAPKTENT